MLRAVVVMRLAIVPKQAPNIILEENPSSLASGMKKPAWTAVNMLHAMISVMEFYPQDAKIKMQTI